MPYRIRRYAYDLSLQNFTCLAAMAYYLLPSDRKLTQIAFNHHALVLCLEKENAIIKDAYF